MDPGIARDWSELSIASVEVESDTEAQAFLKTGPTGQRPMPMSRSSYRKIGSGKADQHLKMTFT